MADCTLDSDDLYVVSDTDPRRADCSFEQGSTIRFFYEEDEPMKPEHDEVKAVEPEAHSADVGASVEHAAPSVEAVDVPQDIAAPSATSAPQAHVEVPDAPNAAPDLSQIQGLAGGNPIVTVVLALIVVGGGTAGWKFWNQKSKQNHELRLQELEVQKELAGLNGAQPPPCSAANVKIQADIEGLRGELRSNSEAHKKLQDQIDELSQKLAKFEKKASSMLSGDFDAEDVVERLEKLEKAAKAAAKKAKA